jgi:hypothetical protein
VGKCWIAPIAGDGSLWTFGINNNGQLGHSKDSKHVEVSSRVACLQQTFLAKVAAPPVAQEKQQKQGGHISSLQSALSLCLLL